MRVSIARLQFDGLVVSRHRLCVFPSNKAGPAHGDQRLDATGFVCDGALVGFPGVSRLALAAIRIAHHDLRPGDTWIPVRRGLSPGERLVRFPEYLVSLNQSYVGFTIARFQSHSLLVFSQGR